MKIKGIIYIVVGVILGLLLSWFLEDKPAGEELSQNKRELTQAEKIKHWTCSMHPQIDLPEPGKCPICGMDLLPKKEEQNQMPQTAVEMTETAMALANVETLVIGNKMAGKHLTNLSLTGKVKENREKFYTQVTHFGGRIEKLYVSYKGQHVKKGMIIASVYSPELVTAQHELLEALYIKNEQPQLYESVRNKLKYWKLSENQIRQIENTKKVIPNFHIRADYSGYVDQMLVSEGDHLKEGTPLYKLSDLSKIWVDFDVYEQDLPFIHVGDELLIKFKAYPAEEIKAKVIFKDSGVNSSTGSAIVRVELDNKKEKYLPGMLAEARLTKQGTKVSSNTASVWVPKTSVLWTGKKSVIYVKLPGKKTYLK